jgi:SAM-dependent methyltransferase
MDQFDSVQMHAHARFQIDKLLHYIINDPKVKFEQLAAKCQISSNDIDRGFETFGKALRDLRAHVQNLINEQHDRYLVNSLEYFHNEVPFELPEHILNRKMQVSETDQELMKGRIRRYTKWQTPGLVIRPAREKWIDMLVSLDPLYIMDSDAELLAPAVSRFHPVYQKRLRQYVIRENIGQPMLAELPQSQFGYCFVYNYLNYRPYEFVCQMLQEIYDALRPGGVVFFTFNDCDQAHGVALSERHWMCYTPGKMLEQRANHIGFDVVDRHLGDNDMAWFELRRPGKFRSLRGGQNLAKVVARSK